MSQLFASGGRSIGVSASTSVLPMNIQDWSPLGWTGWISLQSKGLSRIFSNTTVQKHQFFFHSAFFIVQLSHPYMTTGKTIALTRRIFVGKVNVSAFEYTTWMKMGELLPGCLYMSIYLCISIYFCISQLCLSLGGMKLNWVSSVLPLKSSYSSCSLIIDEGNSF